MKFFADYREYNLEQDSVVVLGKFDGVHVGHSVLFEYAKKCVHNEVIVAFTFLAGENAKVLTKSEEKKAFLYQKGADVVIEQEFTPEFATLLPESFLEEVLVKILKAKYIVCGEDFCFGRNRMGTVEFLRRNADKYGYRLLVVEKQKCDSMEISSTNIRNLILTGDIETANKMLGYSYFIEGNVVNGNQLGRQFDFPTANVEVPLGKLLPKRGVYATLVTVDGKEYYGVTNVGVKPSVGEGNKAMAETFIMDFDRDIYGQKIKVEFCNFFREEKKFEDLQSLFEQISKDVADVKAYFKVE